MKENDLDYEAARNMLIPKAVEYADEIAGPDPGDKGIERDLWAGNWNRTYHKRMDELAHVIFIAGCS